MKAWVKDILVRFYPQYQKFLVWRLRKKKIINVIFFASSLSMWRYQRLYELLFRLPKCNPTIVIHPAIAYSHDQQEEDVAKLIEFFKSKHIPFKMARISNSRFLDIRKELSPDILFYPQPYNNFYPKEISYSAFYDKLLCYCPYAFWTSKGYWSYNQPLHKMAWKLFYSTELHRKDALDYSFRKDTNVEVVGYPTADDFLNTDFSDIWKKQETKKKRIIWASHFTIVSGGYLNQSNFLWMADLMLELARKYSDKIQFVFKPHPRLYTELCKHPEWGEEKAKEYYNLWDMMDNSQVETGEFVNLFMTSDAMIHDCGSFSVEYHYSENPVMYVARNFEEQVEDKNDFGQIAMNLHYVGKGEKDIIDFIENVVLSGNDPMKPQRQQFKQDYLLPPNGKAVAENIIEILTKELDV